MSGKKKSRNTRIEVRISIQLHFDYREERPCATDPIEAHSQYHFTLFLAGRGAGVEGFGFDAVPGLQVGLGAGLHGGQLLLPPMVTLRLMFALSRWSLSFVV